MTLEAKARQITFVFLSMMSLSFSLSIMSHSETDFLSPISIHLRVAPACLARYIQGATLAS